MKSAFKPLARAALVVGVIAITAGGMFLYLNFSRGIRLSLERESALLGADLLVLPAKAKFDPEEALLLGAPEGAYMKDGILDALRQVPEIEKFTPQLYFRSLRLGCCSMRDHPLIGYDPKTDFLLRPLIDEGGGSAKGGVIAGCEAGRRAPRGKVVFFNNPFRIMSVLPCTGMAVDMTFFIPIEESRRIAGTQLKISGHDISGVLVKLRRRDQMDYVVELIEYLADDVKVYKVPEMIRKSAERIRLVERLLGVSLGALAACGAGMVMFAGFVTVRSRMKEAALLRALGAGPVDVVKMFAGEMAVLGAAGSIAGVAAGWLMLAVSRRYLMDGISAPFVFPEPWDMAMTAVLCVAVSILFSIVAGVIVSYGAAKVEPDTALKNTR